MREPTLASSIARISDKRTKNLVRGVLNAGTDLERRIALQNLRNESTARDIHLAYRVFGTFAATGSIANANPEPATLADIRPQPYFDPISLEKEIATVAARLEPLADRLCSQIGAYATLNSLLLSNELDSALKQLRFIHESYGVSLFGMRKALALKHSRLFEDTSWPSIFPMLDPFFTPLRHFVAVAFEDSIDREHQFVEARRRFLQHARNGLSAKSTTPLIFDLLSPCSIHAPTRSATLQAYGRWSALDTVAYLIKIERLMQIDSDTSLTKTVQKAVPDSVWKTWHKLFRDIQLGKIRSFIGRENDFFEYNFFSQTAAWEEYPKVLEYRYKIESSVGDRLDGEFPSRHSLPETCFRKSEFWDDLLPSSRKAKFQYHAITPSECGSFHRTLASIKVYERNKGSLDLSGVDFARLLDATVDMAFLFSTEELYEMVPQSSTDFLTIYLRDALLNDAERRRQFNHRFRRSTQNLIIEEHDGCIIRFAKFLDNIAPRVADHFVGIADEYFLTNLFDLLKTTDDVIETYAALQIWYGETRLEESYIARARTYLLNLRLQKVRGDIDDARIFVDPLVFQHWGQEHHGTKLKNLAALAEAIQEDTLRATELKNPIMRIERPKVELAGVIDACFKEFCENKFFGVDSYIGRRIRHGTLNGFLVTELKPLITEISNDFGKKCPKLKSYFDNWYLMLDEKVTFLGNEQLRIASKDKQHGLISSSITGAERSRLVEQLIDEVLRTLSETQHSATAIANIYEYSWLLLEIDLEKCRRAVGDIRKSLILNPVTICNSCGIEPSAEFSDAVRRVNTEVQGKFERVSGWLSRPKNTTPSTSIAMLFQAVINELNEQFRDFKPSITASGETSINLFGFSFYHFYDALYVMVGNAAKHGIRDGEVGFHVGRTMVGENRAEVTISITSSMPADQFEQARAKIDEAMNASIGDAMVKPGKSGIRKIRALVKEVDEFKAFNCAYHDTRVTFTLTTEIRFNTP